MQPEYVSTQLESSSGSANGHFLILILFRRFVILYICKNNCIRNTFKKLSLLQPSSHVTVFAPNFGIVYSQINRCFVNIIDVHFL